jgi:uncharacterized protein (TIRG00374 family)
MRKFVIALALLLGFIFVIARLTEIQSIAQTLQRGIWWFLGLALIIEILWTLNCGASFQAIYAAWGLKASWNVSTDRIGSEFCQCGCTAGECEWYGNFRQRGKTQELLCRRAAAAGVMYLLFDYLGLIAILVVGLVVVIRRNDLSIVVILASAALVGLTMLFSYLINLGMQSAVSFGNALAKISRIINRILHPFIHREYLSEVKAHEFAHDAAEGLILMRSQPRSILLPVLFAITNKTAQIIILTLVFLAFKVPISIGTIIACFSIATLFVIISPTPAGLGVVEGALTLALTSMYISLEDAAVITLSFRGITFWIPMLMGMISLRALEKVGIQPNANNNKISV